VRRVQNVRVAHVGGGNSLPGGFDQTSVPLTLAKILLQLVTFLDIKSYRR
jgi:hypothetical protein